MIEQLKTIRDFIESAYTTNWPRVEDRNAAHDAIEQLEAMVGEHEPVAYIHRQGKHWEVAERPLLDDEKARGWIEEPLYTAAPVAQQPQGEVVVTWNYDRTRILAVTRQDREGRILKVIAEAPAQQPQEPEMTPAFRSSHAYTVGFQDGKAEALAQQPQAEPDLKDVRCECCGYMTHHREHMGCIRAASKQPQAEPKCECNATMDTFCEVCTEYRKWKQLQAEAVHPAVKPDTLVNRGALQMALNVLRRAGKDEVADELEKTIQQPQAEAVPSDVEVVRKALERAFIMGQNYWADADSESIRANKRSDVTRQKFNAMRDEVCAAIAQQKGQP